MYDALHISCPHSQSDLLHFLDSKNISFRESKTRKGLVEYSFYMKNLYITSRADHLNIKGSISHYTKGNNIHPLAINQIKPAIEKLSNDLGTNIHLGRVTSFEASDSYLVEHNVGHYLDMFKLWRGKEPQYTNDGSRNFGGSTQMKFYDKVKQILAQNHFLPEHYKGTNLLRCELLRKRGLERRGKGLIKPLLVPEMYSEEHIIKISKEYLKNYLLVQKVKVKNGVRMKELDELVKRGVKQYLNP